MASTETVMTRNDTRYEVKPTAPVAERNARVRDLTPAQRRAVVFAQQQVVKARAAKKAKEERQASLNKMWMEEDGMEAGRQRASSTKETQAVSPHRVSLREALGHVLRELRTGDHKTLREVSEKAGVSLGYLSEVERGQKEASSELLSSIADALGLGVPQTLRMVADYLESTQE
ncbi:helix-turn-helix domain-containing protein [Bifidobacterium indicum]|uniref:helix-turn-helix domain-containing protein n=2 Tax=Bifidobacterium TaxID=1678 RepID=UPI00351A9319